MKRHRRHLLMAMVITIVIIILHFMGLLQWILTTAFLLLVFPYLSFSLFFILIKEPKEKQAIDMIKRRYST